MSIAVSGVTHKSAFVTISIPAYLMVILLTVDRESGDAFSIGMLALSLFLLLLRNHFFATQSILNATLDVATVSLYYVPSLFLFVESGSAHLRILLIFLAFSDLLRFAIKAPDVSSARVGTSSGSSHEKGPFISSSFFFTVIFSVLAGASCALPIPPLLRELLYTALFAGALFFLESSLRANTSRFAINLLSFFIFSSIALFLVLAWSGFGRLMVAVYVLAPVLMLQNYGILRLNTLRISLAASVGVYILERSRQGREMELNDLANGSASHHLQVSSDLMTEASIFSTDLSGFLGQVTLGFLNFVPRAVWEDKPVGIGLSIVDNLFGRDGVSSGFSISVGFVGEAVYFLNGSFVAGLLLAFAVILTIDSTIQRMTSRMVFKAVFYASLLSYFWGGFASFGGRFWLLVFPLLFFNVIALLLFRPKNRNSSIAQ